MKPMFTIIGGIIIITIIHVIYKNKKYPYIRCEHSNCNNCQMTRYTPVLSA